MATCRLLARTGRGSHIPLAGGSTASVAHWCSRLATCRRWSPSEPARSAQHDPRRRLSGLVAGPVEARSSARLQPVFAIG